jgi:hypothetical protein
VSLLFPAVELRKEIHALRRLAGAYLDAGSQRALAGAENALDQICVSNSSRSYPWQIVSTLPVRTLASEGEYMRDRRGQATVHAEITFIWEMQPERPRGNTRPAKMLRLAGKASTRIRILEGSPPIYGPGKELAMWRMEVADDSAPGSYFHVQVHGRRDDEYFPHMLDIPRLPGAVVSPFACIEFVLAELFQDRWAEHTDRDFSDVRDWRGVQLKRLVRQLQWHGREIQRASGSPWSAWKKAIPPEDLFTSSD